MDMTAVPTQMLTDIGDAIREKRDIATTIPVSDMPLQIRLIEGGSDWKHTEVTITKRCTTGNQIIQLPEMSVFLNAKMSVLMLKEYTTIESFLLVLGTKYQANVLGISTQPELIRLSSNQTILETTSPAYTYTCNPGDVYDIYYMED